MITYALFLQAPGGIGIYAFLPYVLIFAVFYFLIIAPQRKRQRELQATVANLKAGDRIITSGGIIATITAVRDTSLIVRTAEKSMLEVTRASVAGLQVEEEKKL